MCRYELLEDTARYAGLLLAPAEDFALPPRTLWPFLFWPLAKALVYRWQIQQKVHLFPKFTHISKVLS